MTRTVLFDDSPAPGEPPPRRQGYRDCITWAGNRIHLTANFDEQDRPIEIFIHGGKSGSDFEALCTEFAILLSKLLQSGTPATELPRLFGREYDGKPASIAGAAADWLAGLRRFAA